MIIEKYLDGNENLPIDIDYILYLNNIDVIEMEPNLLPQVEGNNIYGRISILGSPDKKFEAIIQIPNNLGSTMRRFVLAHEFAHYVMIKQNPIHILLQKNDFSYLICDKKQDEDEIVCDIFAEFLLLPPNEIRELIGNYIRAKNNSNKELNINEFFMYLCKKAQIPLYVAINSFNHFKQLPKEE